MEKEYSKHTPYLVLFIGLFSVLALFISTFKRAYSFYTAIVTTSSISVTAQQRFALLNTGHNINSALQSVVGEVYESNADTGEVTIDFCDGDTCSPIDGDCSDATRYLVSASNSPEQVYLYACANTVWFYSPANVIYLNPDSSTLFGENGFGVAQNKTYISTINFSRFNTSLVTNMAYMFGDTRNLSIDSLSLNKWNVSSVTNMAGMFANSSMEYTSNMANLTGWDVQGVTNAYYMFFQANIQQINLNKTKWTALTNGSGAFAVGNNTYGIFTPISIKSGTNMTATSMYLGGEGFADGSTYRVYTLLNSTTPTSTLLNRAFSMLDTGPTIKNKITSFLSGWSSTSTCDGVPQMDIYTNSNCSDYVGTRLVINSSNSTVPVYLMHDDGCYMSFCTASRQVYANPNASYMFSDRNEQYFEFYNLVNLNTIYATNMYGMFNNCNITHLDIDGWITSNVTNMASMFSSSSFYSVNDPGSGSDTLINLSGWNVKSVTNMSSMFRNTKYNGTINLQNWNTYQVRDMSRMFEHSRKYNIITNGWNTWLLNNTQNMFYYTNNLLSLNMYSWNLYNLSVNANNTNMFTASAIRNFYSPKYIRAGINIMLPRTFKYGSTSYTKLNSTTPKQVLFQYN